MLVPGAAGTVCCEGASGVPEILRHLEAVGATDCSVGQVQCGVRVVLLGGPNRVSKRQFTRPCAPRVHVLNGKLDVSVIGHAA